MGLSNVNLPKAASGTAKILITAGVLLLTFMVYQLWGTGLQHARAQNALKGDFAELIAGQDGAGEQTGELSKNQTALVASISQTGDFTPGSEFQISSAVAESLPLLYRDQGEAVARLSIRKINVSEIIVEGTNVDDLKKGPGHYGTTPLPGQPGNASVAGHRTTYGAPFANIHKLQEGDEIVVETVQGTFTYNVIALEENSAHRIVSPGQANELDYKQGNHLTLTSCHPRFSAEQRIIVRAELQGKPAAPLPRPEQIAENGQTFIAGTAPALSTASFGTGLNGDSSVIPSAVLWGLAMTGLFALAAVLGVQLKKRNGWGKWRVYTASLIPVGFSIYVFFYYLDAVLPSY